MSGHATRRPPAADWHKADIKAALEKRGWSLRRLGIHLDLSPATLREALRKRYPACERRIADALGVHPMVIWPSRYNKDGTPNSVRGNPNWQPRASGKGKRSTARSLTHVKSARAA